MATTVEPKISLRDLKARQTRQTLHHAAVNRVLADGLEQATIANIAADAGVSTRTFFNYFATKEDAVVGVIGGPLDDEVITEFVNAAPVYSTLAEDVARLVQSAFIHTFSQEDTKNNRRKVLFKYPELLLRQAERTSDLEENIAHAVRARLAHWQVEFSSEESAMDVSRMLVLIGAVPLRSTFNKVKEDPESYAGEKASALLFEQSVDLYKKVLAKLS